MVYPVTATLSVDADHVRTTECLFVVDAMRFVGTDGGVESGVVPLSVSKAPMSQRAPWGRLTPRWSVLPLHRAKLVGITLMAGLPDISAIVCVRPPFGARGPSSGSVLLSEGFEVAERDEVP